MLRHATAFDAARLVGLHYDPATFDCGHFFMRARRELFGQAITLPGRHPRGRRGQAALIGRLSAELAEQVDAPQSGDAVIYEQDDEDGGTHLHLGMVFVELGELWVLHLPEGGTSVLQREDDVRVHGLRRLGFYRLPERA